MRDRIKVASLFCSVCKSSNIETVLSSFWNLKTPIILMFITLHTVSAQCNNSFKFVVHCINYISLLPLYCPVIIYLTRVRFMLKSCLSIQAMFVTLERFWKLKTLKGQVNLKVRNVYLPLSVPSSYGWKV